LNAKLAAALTHLTHMVKHLGKIKNAC